MLFRAFNVSHSMIQCNSADNGRQKYQYDHLHLSLDTDSIPPEQYNVNECSALIHKRSTASKLCKDFSDLQIIVGLHNSGTHCLCDLNNTKRTAHKYVADIEAFRHSISDIQSEVLWRFCCLNINQNLPYKTYLIASQEATLKNSIPSLQS